MGYRDEDPRDCGMEEELERQSRHFRPVPSFCRTEDEYREWLRGDLDDWELRQRRAGEREHS